MKYRIALLLAAAAASAPAQTGVAEGRMLVNGAERVLKYVRVAKVPQDDEPGKTELRVVLSDAPVPLKAVIDDMKLFDMTSSGEAHVVELILTDGGVW